MPASIQPQTSEGQTASGLQLGIWPAEYLGSAGDKVRLVRSHCVSSDTESVTPNECVCVASWNLSDCRIRGSVGGSVACVSGVEAVIVAVDVLV